MRHFNHLNKDSVIVFRSYTLIRALRIAHEGGDLKELEKPSIWTRQHSFDQINFNPLVEK